MQNEQRWVFDPRDGMVHAVPEGSFTRSAMCGVRPRRRRQAPALAHRCVECERELERLCALSLQP